MCHIVFVLFLGANVIMSPPYPVPCPRRVIAEELLRQAFPPPPVETQKPRVVDPFQPITMEI